MALIPSKVKKDFAEGRLKALPLGGTAIKSSVSGHDVEGKAFCFLPLPTNTGLPCHVNGHFVVYGNRNTLFWGDNKADVRYMWNKLLLQQTVAHSYASCLKKIKEQLPCEVSLTNIECLQAFYAHFPCFEMIKSDIWKELALSVFVDICRRELPLYTTCPYTAVSDTNPCDEGINWVAMKSKEYTLQPCFDSLNDKTQSIDSNEVEYEMSSQSLSKEIEMDSDSEGERTNTSLLRIVLVELGLKLICTPPHVYTTIKQLLSFKESNTIEQYITADLNIQQVTPSIVIECLSSWSSSVEDKCRIDAVDLPLDQTIFKSMERFKCVLLFCLSSTNSELFPFVVDNAGSLQTYNSSIILSEYCDLLPGSRERFLHEDLIVSFTDSHSFKELNLEVFSSLLHHTLDQSKYGANSPLYLSNENTELPDLPWLKKFWKFLNQFDSMNQKLNAWSLVPSTTDRNQTLLFPIQLTYAIVDATSFTCGTVAYRSIYDALTKLCLPLRSPLTRKSKHVRKLVASKDEPLNFVKCLIHHRNKVANSSLSIEECNCILSFLSSTVDKFKSNRDILQELRNLKLFVTVENDIVSLEGSSVVVLKIDGISMITEGLQEWAIKTNRVLLRYNPYHETIYEVLVFCLCYGETDEHNLLDFYVRYVLPDFEYVPSKSHIAHLTFVKNTLLRQQSFRLKQKLPTLRLFCVEPNGRLNVASTFHNPHNEVFKSLCSREKFPPDPFCDKEWEEFMLLAGINDNVSKSMFKKFAIQITHQGPCLKSLSQSKILVRHLFSQEELQEDNNFLMEVSKIKFILSHKCPSQLTNICSQTQSNSLIEFNGSLIQKSFHLAWTTMKILPEYATPTTGLQKALQVVDEPEVNFFVKHLENIFLALTESKIESFHEEFIKNVLPRVYDHMNNLVINSILSDDVINGIKEIPLVHVKQHNVFIKAKQVILRESTLKEIRPYLLVGSEQYGQYYELFRKLGACDNLVLNHYFIALACIKEETGDDKLSMEELQAIDRVMEGMLDILQHRASPGDDLVVDEPVLYLPSRNDVLTKSTELIFCDNKLLEKRIKDQKEIVFIKSVECFNKKGFDVKKCLKLLPQTYKLQFLSEVVVEKLDAFKNIVSWDVARTLEQIVTSELFQHCMLRLIKSGDLTNNLSDDFISKVKTNLTSFRVVCLSNVFTVLEYQDTLIQNSRDEKQSFYCKRDNTLYVTQSDQGQQSWMKKNHRVLAYAVQKLCDHKAVQDKLLTILISFTFSVKDMDDLLEKLDVPALDFTPEYEPWIPELGSIVPFQLLPLLVQEMVQFKEGDLAVYEIIDNRFDEDRTDEVVFYVYVKILKICESKTLPKYEIDLGEEQPKTVLGDRLFKIIRKRKAKNDKGQQEENSLVVYDNISGFSQERPKESKTFDDIIEEIEEELIAAWREGPDVFKRVYRRQLLTWHPDKHGNSEESNEITKHLIQFAKDIQSGKIDINSFPTKRDRQNKRRKNKGGSRPWWGNQSSRRQNTDNSYGYSWFDPSSFAENINREYTRSRCNSEESYSEPRANPQPKMAKVWFRQAKNDLKSAASLYEAREPASYNWVCVMCHQAAEKAIKSLQVQEDADKVRMDHSLFTSHSMNNQTLREAAEQLERLAVHHTRMRYPRPSEYPRTPSDLYTEQMAADCIRYTKTIIETVQGLLRT